MSRVMMFRVGQGLALAALVLGSAACSGQDGAPGQTGPQGDPGPQGEMGEPGPQGDTGAKGDAGFVLKDGAGAVLGTIVTMQTGLFMVRGPQDALIYYSMTDGKVLSAAGRVSDPLYFASADCSGPPLVSTTLVDAGMINDGHLYKATLPYRTSTSHSELSDEAGACLETTTMDSLMATTLVGEVPEQAVMPLSVE